MPPCSAAVLASATSSSVLAKRLGMYWSDELTPSAPSRIAVATSSCILVDLVGGGRPVGLADDVVAQSARPDEGADVDRRRRALEPGEVLGQGAPVLHDLEEIVGRLAIGQHLVVHRRNRHALAGDLGGDALGDLAGGAAVHQHVELRLAEQVDEARRHHLSGGVDAGSGRGPREIANRGDAIADDADIAAEPRRSGAVHHAAVRDHEIEGPRGGQGRRRRRGRGGRRSRRRRTAAGGGQSGHDDGEHEGGRLTHGRDCIVCPERDAANAGADRTPAAA